MSSIGPFHTGETHEFVMFVAYFFESLANFIVFIHSRYDSTISIPYNKWVYYDPRIKQKEQNRNYAANKTKKVAWFVSNCGALNGRLVYAKELQKHIQVIIST